MSENMHTTETTTRHFVKQPDKAVQTADAVNHPSHYTSDPSGIECIEITRHRNFNVGNAIKYLWRAGLKSDSSLADTEKQVEDLRKAIFYINDEINRIERIQYARDTELMKAE